MADLVLAIDLGSSWCKAAYIDRFGNILAEGRAPTRNIEPAPEGMLEQFWAAVVGAVQGANQALATPPQLLAISLSCRALFGICLDEAGAAFFPAWDVKLNRANPAVQYAYSAEIWGDQDPFGVGYGMMLASAGYWLRTSRPQEWQRIARTGALHDYIIYQLTGQWVTDPTSGPSPGRWPDEFTTITGLPLEAFPQTLEPQSLAGGLVVHAANALGLPTATPVVVGMHDGAAANLGVAAVKAGDACLTLGTNFVFRPATGERLTTRCFSYRIVPGTWAWVNNVPIASTQLDIVAETLLPDVATMAERHRQLGQLTATVAPGAEGVVIQRILPGQEDLLRENVRLLIIEGVGNVLIYRALLEAIAYGVRDLVNTAKRDGAMPQRYVASGGSARNEALIKVLAAVLNTPIEIGRAEAGLIGAAMAAAVYSNWYESLHEAVKGMGASHPVIVPDVEAIAYYRQGSSS